MIDEEGGEIGAVLKDLCLDVVDSTATTLHAMIIWFVLEGNDVKNLFRGKS